jgi:hypothetical protein
MEQSVQENAHENARENARVYRERADQARLGAKEATRADFRAVFERLAVSYDTMARDADGLSQSSAG